ncbi:MAG: hypothetical protein N3A54_01580 [Patescibacteria group bacterium]|nr:hypothetical protein [Patescibacteria group bacterium]
MATLTEVSYYTRRAINWSILGIIIYIILRLLWSGIVTAWMILFSSRPAPPNHGFGKLPAIVFSSEQPPNYNLTFTLETISGTFPSMPSMARVYFMPKKAPNLLAINQAQDFAKRLNFDPTPIQESRTVYRFRDFQTILRNLRYDIVSENFMLEYGYGQDIGVFSEGILRDPNAIKEEAIKFIQNLNLFYEDFSKGEQKVTLLKLVGNTLIPISNISETSAMRVDFFRGPVNNLKVVTKSPSEGQIQILFSPSSDSRRRILELIYTFWPIDYDTFATYSLRPIAQAWQELQNGQGYIAQYPLNNSSEAVVRNAYLAYFDSFDPQTYLQPIYVFEGDFGFTAYVPAIAPEWIE